MIFASKDCFISRPKWITLKLCQTRAKGKKNVCTRAHVLPFRRGRKPGTRRLTDGRSVKNKAYYLLHMANMTNIPWTLEMHLGCRRAKEN